MREKLAVLVPVYNGGEMLANTISSCAQSGLSADRYEILVVDNCSTDGAASRIPARDEHGASVRVFRNSSNLGRVGNWNQAASIAQQQGFRYATFLFVGDSWLPSGSLPQLLDLIQETDADIGFSPFVIADSDGRAQRHSQRFYVSGQKAVVTTPRRFVDKLIESGLFPLGPIQANIYRVDSGPPIRFDAAVPTRTDVEATLQFLTLAKRPVAIVSEPFFQWREYKSRFHMSMGAAQTVRDYITTFRCACSETENESEIGLAKSRLILNALRLAHREARPSEWHAIATDLVSFATERPYRALPAHMFQALWSRFVNKARLLEFGNEAASVVRIGDRCAIQ